MVSTVIAEVGGGVAEANHWGGMFEVSEWRGKLKGGYLR